MKELELKNVCKDYKLENKIKFRALNDISVSFDKGELVSIIGESGCGKSTLMNLIGGLDFDYTGEIKIGGIDLKSFKEKELDDYRKKKIGFVFQSFNLIPHLSILDNVTIALTLSDVKESEKLERAKEILKKVGLENQLKKKPTQLSGGQKQRVAIARALINNPDIILADEPTGALDSANTLQILDIMKKIADDGKLVVMVTHSEKVAKISSRIVELSDGRIINDKINKKYEKDVIEQNTEINNKENHVEITNDNKKEKPKKEKHLSLFSAMRLSLHNMWASKTKNFLMALGVSISLISMILMLAFGSGLTNYISSTAESYSNPYIVTISKKSNSDDPMTGGFMGFLTPNPFTDEEIDQAILDLNNYLDTTDNQFRVDKNEVDYGFSALTGFTQSASVVYGDTEKDKTGIFYLYTTPSYYGEEQLLAGNLSTDNTYTDTETGETIGEVMFSSKIVYDMGYSDMEEAIGKVVTVSVNYNKIEITQKMKITGIVNVNSFDQMLVMYIDYNYLSSLVKEKGGEISPSSLFITTDSQETTDLLNAYLTTSDKYTGSIENQMANMFTEMMSTFSIVLAIIAGISLFVAMIMILVVLYMSVSERTKEIGVLKSIGARKRDIKKIFTTESFLIGLLSGIVGIVFSLIIGGIFTILFNALLGFAPLTFNWYYFAIALGLSILISVLAGLYPASKAAKLDPVESLRHE